MTELVRIDNLVKHFGPIKAVDGVSFSVERGEVLGFWARTEPGNRPP